LNPLLEKLDKASKDYDNGDITNNDVTTLVENVYCEIADILTACAENFVPERKKSFYRFWWDEELKLSKETSVESNRLWKIDGKPRQGSIFDKRQAARLHYRKCLRDSQRRSDEMYTNELHEAHTKKEGTYVLEMLAI